MQNNENSNAKDNENLLLLNRLKFLKSTIHKEEQKNSTLLINRDKKK